MSRRSVLAIVAALVACSGLARPVSAELVFLSSGRTLSVKSHRLEGTSIVLQLRGGGEIVCDQALVTEIRADEVPYPEPAPPAEPDTLPSVDAGPYAEMIDQLSAAHGVDAKLVKAVIQVESRYHPGARSPKGAMGLMQLMPDTARRLSVRNPYDVRSNLDAGITHLKSLLDRFEVSLALAAYNAGEAAVERFRGIPPYPETRNYVRQVLRLAGLPR